MIQIYSKVKSPHEHVLKEALEKLNQPPISLQFHELSLPLQYGDERNFIFYEIEDDTLVSELKQIKDTQGQTDLILLVKDPNLLIPYASLRLFGWIITTNWEDSMKILLPSLQEEMTMYSCSIHYHSRFLDFTLHPSRILYMESYHHEIYIYTDTIKLKVRGTLREYCIDNPYVHLVQVHKSFIVNLMKIQYIKGSELVINHDISIPVGDAYKEHLNEQFKRYFK